MGRMVADGFAGAVADGSITLDAALQYHLQVNHYPPVHPVFLDTAKEAIQRAQSEEWDELLTMPNGVTLTVGEIVYGLHLDAFINIEEEE